MVRPCRSAKDTRRAQAELQDSLLIFAPGIGDQARCFDPVHGADFIVIGGIAADPDRADHLALTILDQHAAG